jgi:hypothetical protein
MNGSTIVQVNPKTVSSCAALASETANSMVSDGTSPATENTAPPMTNPPSAAAGRRIGMSYMAAMGSVAAIELFG